MSETPYQKDQNLPRGIKWVKSLSYLLDEQFRFPGTRFRFGIDPVINLIPGIGDLSGFLLSGALLMGVARKSPSQKLIVLMCINILLDATIGAIPLIGQIFDFFFKSNTRNLKLIQEHYLEGKHQGSGKNAVVIAVVSLVLILFFLIFILFKLVAWMFNW